MRNSALAFVGGVVFGTGLVLSRLVDPATVLAYLDLASGSDAVLPTGMVLSAATFGLLYRSLVRRSRRTTRPIEPARLGRIDRPLVVGSLLFGAGWGLTGLCPGPVVVSLGAGAPAGAWFAIALVAGLLVGDPRPAIALLRRRAAASVADPDATRG